MCMHRNVFKHKAWTIILLVLIIIHCLKSDWKKNWCKGSVKQAGVINFPTYLKTFLAVIEKVTRPSRSWFPCVRNSAQLHAHDAYRSQIKKTHWQKIVDCWLDYIKVVGKSFHFVLLSTIQFLGFNAAKSLISEDLQGNPRWQCDPFNNAMSWESYCSYPKQKKKFIRRMVS